MSRYEVATKAPETDTLRAGLGSCMALERTGQKHLEKAICSFPVPERFGLSIGTSVPAAAHLREKLQLGGMGSGSG